MNRGRSTKPFEIQVRNKTRYFGLDVVYLVMSSTGTQTALVNVQDAKTRFSRYVDRVEQGEVVVICRHNKPVAELRPIAQKTVQAPRTPGLLKGLIGWKQGAFEPMSDEELVDFDGPLFPR